MKIDAPESGHSDIDMTPLIDCVFLLILFFLLTTNLTIQFEEVSLPFALEGKEAETGSPEVVQPLIINVLRDSSAPSEERAGLIRFNGSTVDKKTLEQQLPREAPYDAEERPLGRGRGYERGPNGQNLSKLSVLVRSDRSVRSEYTRQVFEACGKAKIYKVKVSALEP